MNFLSVVASCLIWIPLAIWVISMVNWTVQGEVAPEFGVPAIVMGFLLGLTAAFPPDPALSPLIFIAVVATILCYPLVRNLIEKRAHAEIDLSHMEAAYEMLEAKPDNVGASLRIAEALYRRGLVGHAIAVAESGLSGAPSRLFEPEERRVAGWKAAARDASYYRPIPCTKCGARNPPSGPFCPTCGAPYLLEFGRAAWLAPGTGSRWLAGWTASILALVLIPFTARLVWPLPLAIGLIVLEVAAAAFLLARAFRGDK